MRRLPATFEFKFKYINDITVLKQKVVVEVFPELLRILANLWLASGANILCDFIPILAIKSDSFNKLLLLTFAKMTMLSFMPLHLECLFMNRAGNFALSFNFSFPFSFIICRSIFRDIAITLTLTTDLIVRIESLDRLGNPSAHLLNF